MNEGKPDAARASIPAIKRNGFSFGAIVVWVAYTRSLVAVKVGYLRSPSE